MEIAYSQNQGISLSSDQKSNPSRAIRRIRRRFWFLQRTRGLESFYLRLTFHVVPFVFFQTILQSLNVAWRLYLLNPIILFFLVHLLKISCLDVKKTVESGNKKRRGRKKEKDKRMALFSFLFSAAKRQRLAASSKVG